jgi:two-component system response regulator NreC
MPCVSLWPEHPRRTPAPNPENGADPLRSSRPARVANYGRLRCENRGVEATGRSVRVLVVDDHAVVRTGLRRVLDAQDDIETVGEAPDAERAVFEAIATKPDVVLLDVMMPGKTGIEVLPSLQQAVPAAKVLVLSMQDDPRYVREAFEAGASGYVLKEAADTDVVGAVRAVAAGEQYVHPALGAKLFAAEASERRRAERDPLSEREREVLRLLALGHTNQEIAKTLYISVRTAETHRAHIMQKLRLSSRAELVRYALDHGMIES